MLFTNELLACLTLEDFQKLYGVSSWFKALLTPCHRDSVDSLPLGIELDPNRTTYIARLQCYYKSFPLVFKICNEISQHNDMIFQEEAP